VECQIDLSERSFAKNFSDPIEVNGCRRTGIPSLIALLDVPGELFDYFLSRRKRDVIGY
jgi:hypothetical protein